MGLRVEQNSWLDDCCKRKPIPMASACWLDATSQLGREITHEHSATPIQHCKINLQISWSTIDDTHVKHELVNEKGGTSEQN